MDKHRSNPTEPPPSPTERQRALEQATDRAWRAARFLLITAFLLPFVAYQAFHVTFQTALLMHLVLAFVGWRSWWQWLLYKRALDQTMQPRSRGPAPPEKARRWGRAQGSYPSSKVRILEAADALEWATVTQGMELRDLVGSFDDRPVYQWVRLDDRWYRYETVDRLASPINDQEHHLLLGGLRYLLVPEPEGPAPGAATSIPSTAPPPVA